MSFPPSDAKQIFLEAVQLPDLEQRAAFLDRACGPSGPLRGRVDELLRAHQETGSFLDRPAIDELSDTGTSGAADAEAAGLAALQVDPSRAGTARLDYLEPCSTPGRLGRLGVYEIIEVIGQGGMGIVLKAHDTKLNRIVAIKLLAPSLAAHPTATKRFLREAQAAAAVSHDHVITIFAVEEASVPPYLVMECVVGQSLQEKIDRHGTLQTTEILRIGLQIADGLTAAHKQGLVHRDIKPSNILLENGVERVKITDFGLARAMDDVSFTQTGQIAGTPQYMSPEQAMGDRLDARSDLFSLGSVLYSMCTGRPAFRADSTPAVLKRVCEDVPRPIQQINPEIPEWLVCVIDRLLAKRPEDRIQSAAEVSELLSAYLVWLQQPQGRVAPALPPPVAASNRWKGRLVRLALAAMVMLFALWVVLFPTMGLLVYDESQITFELRDGDTVVELLRDGDLVAAQKGYGRLNVPAGVFQFRVPERPGMRLYHFVFEHRPWWWLGRNQVTLTSPPQSLPLHRGDQIRIWLSFAAAPVSEVTASTGDQGDDRPPLAVVPFDEPQARAHQEAWAEHESVPLEYTDPLGITFRLIPAGSFEMGSTPSEINAVLREIELHGAGEFDKFAARSSAPRHAVQLTRPFYIGVSEVTFAQFRRFVEETGYKSTLEAVQSPPFTWKSLGEQADDDQPVCGVSWEDAKAFCRWLSDRHPVQYDLPTEAQWEYACRAGNPGLWSFGNNLGELDRHAVCDPQATAPSAVRSKKPNAFGLYDMHGNVDEWCLDWHRSDFYGRSPSADPACLEESFDPASGRVTRGGSWGKAAWWTRSASRCYDFPALPMTSKGFRVVIGGDLKQLQQESPHAELEAAEASP